MVNRRFLAGVAFSALFVSAFAQNPMDPSTAPGAPMADTMAPTSIAVTFNGSPVAFPDTGPMLREERVFVPAGPVAEWMGATLEPTESGMTVVKGARTYAIPGEGLVSLRDLVASFGGTVEYDKHYRTARITLNEEMRQNPGGTELYAPDAAGMYAPDTAGSTTPTITSSSRPQGFVTPNDGTATSSWTDYLSWIVLSIAILALAIALLSRKPARVIASDDTDRNR
ncbi:hypothetical protein EON79_04935 [bacterium]|nr:MAG: hypothetical protein EON79_04935 [bacterium]